MPSSHLPRLLAVALALSVLAQAQAKPTVNVQDKLLEEIYAASDRDDPASLQRIEALLAKGAKIRPQGDQMQPMHIAIDRGRADVVGLFIQKKIDVQAPITPSGPAALLYVFKQNPSTPEASKARERIIHLLLDAGANPNGFDQLGDSPLGIAAGNGMVPADPVMLGKLLQKGANAKAVSAQGYTVLMGSAAGHLPVLKQLIAAGADPHAMAKSTGATPLHSVCDRGGLPSDAPPKPDPEAAERIRLLLKPGLDINAYPKGLVMQNPLGKSLNSDNPDCVAALIKAGASVNAVARDPAVVDEDKGLTVLQIARKYGHVHKAVKQVIEAAAKTK